VLIAAVLSLALVRLANIYLYFSLPVEITYGESIMVRIARDYRDGMPIYREFHQQPYIFAPYGPLAYTVPAWISSLTGGDATGLLRIGRGVSLTGSAASLLLIALMLIRKGVAWPIIVLADLMFFSAEITWPVQMTFRPDSMEVCWVLAGLATASMLESTRWQVIALVPLLVACLFKQSAIIAPAVLGLYLLMCHGVGPALRFSLAALAIFGGTFVVLNHVTLGLYCQNAVVALFGNMTWRNPVEIGRSVLEGDPALVALAVAAIACRCITRRFDLLTLYVLIGALFAVAGTLRDGSATNYFLAVGAVSTIIGAEALATWTGFVSKTRHWQDASPGQGPAPPAAGSPWSCVAGMGVLLLALFTTVPRLSREVSQVQTLAWGLQSRQKRDEVELKAVKSVAEALDALGGPILSQDNDINLRTRNAIMLELLTFGSLADQGRFDDRDLIDMIRTQKLSGIVLQFPLSIPEVPRYQGSAWVREQWIKAIREGGYEETTVSNRWYLYKPAKPVGSSILIQRMLRDRAGK
jgi:hypothetical protein